MIIDLKMIKSVRTASAYARKVNRSHIIILFCLEKAPAVKGVSNCFDCSVFAWCCEGSPFYQEMLPRNLVSLKSWWWAWSYSFLSSAFPAPCYVSSASCRFLTYWAQLWFLWGVSSSRSSWCSFPEPPAFHQWFRPEVLFSLSWLQVYRGTLSGTVRIKVGHKCIYYAKRNFLFK